MKKYEVTILVNAGLARADQEGVLAKVRGYYETEGAQWIECEVWEERKLAYPIHGETSALFLVGYFEADPAAIEKIERRCTLSDEVLRQLIIVRDGKGYDRIREQRAKAAEAAAAREAAAAEG